MADDPNRYDDISGNLFLKPGQTPDQEFTEALAKNRSGRDREILARVDAVVDSLPDAVRAESGTLLADVQASVDRAEAAAGQAASAAVESAVQVAAAASRAGLREAPQAGSWAVGTDWRGRNLGAATDTTGSSGSTAPRQHEAPHAGAWLVGSDWRGMELGAGGGASQTTAPRQYEAPTAGAWVVGSDWRGVQIGAPASGSTPTATVDRAAIGAGLSVSTAEGLRPWTSDPTRVAAWGDSLTEGYPKPPFTADTAWPGVLDSLWAGSVYNGGHSAHTAAQIAMLQGGLVLHTSAPLTIPGDGSPVPVTFAGGAIPASFALTFSGALGGVPVVLANTVDAATRTTAAWTVKRAAAGAAVSVPAGTALDPGTGIHRDAVTVIFAGRNDLVGITPDIVSERVTRILAATDMMVAHLTPRRPRVLLVGTITATNEPRGHAANDAVREVNRQLAAAYPGQTWPLQDYLTGAALADSGLTPTQADRDALANGTVPPSLFQADGVHYTPQTAALVAAQIKQQLTNRRYIA